MNSLLRIFGMLLIFVSVLGLVGSVAGIYYSWSVHDRWTVQAVAQLGAVEDGLGYVTDVSDKARSVLRKAKVKIDELDKLVKLAAEELKKKGKVDTVFAGGLENELVEWCDQAKEWLQTLEQTAETARTTLALFSALPLSGRDESTEKRSEGLQIAAKKLSEITPILKDLSEWIGELRDRKNLQLNVGRLADLMTDINGRLEAVRTELRDFDKKIQTWRTAAKTLKAEVPDLLVYGTWLATGLLTWFAVAQISLMLHGWTLARKEDDPT